MSTLQERHPVLMVPHVVTFGVVIYTNGGFKGLDTKAIREALVQQFPPGIGVGDVSCTHHGVYEGEQGVKRDRP